MNDLTAFTLESDTDDDVNILFYSTGCWPGCQYIFWAFLRNHQGPPGEKRKEAGLGRASRILVAGLGNPEVTSSYPDFCRDIYLKGYRYNLHFRPRSVLLEVGAQTSTYEESVNAREPFANIIRSGGSCGNKSFVLHCIRKNGVLAISFANPVGGNTWQ